MSEGLPSWQHGYDLEVLRAATEPFKVTDEGIVRGAFTGFKERDVADAMHRGGFMAAPASSGRVPAALVWKRMKARTPVRDFTGEQRATMLPGDIQVSRMGCLRNEPEALVGLLKELTNSELQKGQALWVTAWQESRDLEVALECMPFVCVATKVPASAELVGVYAVGLRELHFEAVPARDEWALERLTVEVPQEALEAAVGALRRLPGWADHYSSYNVGHAWSAVALRGYDDDPMCIVKPAEMSKAWKGAHTGMLRQPVRDTPLRAALPELEPLIALVPGEHQRVRLMRLAPGGGELTRHADITDPEAGTGTGKLLRIHVPLLSNDEVLFSAWELSGRKITRHMAPGQVWYLDTRKPHTAVNGGSTERVHLVIDAYSSDELLELLEGDWS